MNHKKQTHAFYLKYERQHLLCLKTYHIYLDWRKTFLNSQQNCILFDEITNNMYNNENAIYFGLYQFTKYSFYHERF